MSEFSLTVDFSSIPDGERAYIEGEAFLSEIETPTATLPLRSPLHYEIQILRNKEDFLLSGTVSAVLEYPCARCLESVDLALSGQIEATYKKSPKKISEEEIELEDLENVIYYEAMTFDLSERLIEAILVEIPSKVLCKEDCKGICPYCGENLNNVAEHRCKIESELSPGQFLSALKRIAIDDTDSNNNQNDK